MVSKGNVVVQMDIGAKILEDENKIVVGYPLSNISKALNTRWYLFSKVSLCCAGYKSLSLVPYLKEM
jgi:hypothetical protein